MKYSEKKYFYQTENEEPDEWFEINIVVYLSVSHAAEEAAEEYTKEDRIDFDNITITLQDENRKDLGKFFVEIEFQPVFSATKKE